MNKIRKGSIVWDRQQGEFTKVLNDPIKGEVSDDLFIKTGRKYHQGMKGMALCSGGVSERMKCNNIPCYLKRVTNLIPQKEYLEIQKELIIKYN